MSLKADYRIDREARLFYYAASPGQRNAPSLSGVSVTGSVDIRTQVVPVTLVLIPGVGDHVSRAVKPVPLAIRIQVPAVADRLPGIAQIKAPGTVRILLPAGFPWLLRLLDYIILYVSTHTHQPLTPSSGRPGIVPTLTVGHQVL